MPNFKTAPGTPTPFFTRSLFYEQRYALQEDKRNCEAVYSLYTDVDGLINFGKEYVKDMDPTGYSTAIRLLDGYAHWQVLAKMQWFRQAKEMWDEEIEARIKSEAFKEIRRIAADPDDKGQLQAAKLLATQGLTEKKSTRGRPTSLEVEAAIKQEKEDKALIEKDAERVSNVISLAKGK